MAEVDVILDKLEPTRAGDASGGFNPYDSASPEGAARKVDATRDAIDRLRRAVAATAAAAGAALPPLD